MRLVDGYEKKNHWKDDKGVEAAYNLYFDLLCLQRFYPHYGDAAICGRTDAMFSASDRGISGLHSWRQRNKTVAREYALVFDSTGIERFARIAWYLNGKTVDGLRLSLYDPDPEAIQGKIQKVIDSSVGPVERSFAAPILGMAILKSGAEGRQRALWLRGNRRNQTSEGGWHGHADSMNLGLFAHGLNIMPDLGYMDQKRWVFGHNTVSLQKGSIPKPTTGIGVHEQDPNLPKPILSEIAFIAEFPGMQVVRAVGTEHPDSSRTVLMVDVDKDNFYLVDHLRVGPSVLDEFATYSFHTNQGKLTTNLEWKKSAEAIEGTTRMFGKWVPPLFDAPQEKIINPWWAEVAIDDTYGLLEGKSDVKVRFTALRASDRVSHSFYAPPKAEPVVPKRLPYLFLSLAKPEDKDEPRLFTSLIEPYRTKRPVASAAIISGRPADAEIIAVSQADGKELALLISDGKEEYPFHAGQAKADVAAITTHEGNVIGIALRGQYVRILTEAIALEAVGDKGAIASGGITFGPEREVFEFALSTPLRIILPGMFTISVKEGAHVSDIQTAVSTMSFVLTPDPATGGRGTFTVKPK
jgi:hypothetical protein